MALKPWQRAPADKQSSRQVTVVGAGLAGCSTARALAERGYCVTLIDRLGVAQAASGNPQGGLYIKLAAGDNAVHSEFYRSAYGAALASVERTLGPAIDNPHWRQCGVLQLAYSDKEQQRQHSFMQRQQPPPELLYAVDAEQASELAGIALPAGGLFFPNAGWVSPAAYCEALIQHPNIELQRADVRALTTMPNGWQIQTEQSVWHSPQVIVANAYDARTLLPEAYLPIKRIRGQLSLLSADNLPSLKVVLCARSYMPPAVNGQLCLGATYNLRDDDPAVRDQDHLANLAHLSDFGLDETQAKVMTGRVGFRCTTPDYLPMAGPVVDSKATLHQLAPMVNNAKHIPPGDMPYRHGLWLNIGHGSRGLASAALCAELLAAQLDGDALPVATSVAEALAPCRFLLRDMIRRKVSAEALKSPA